MSKRAHISALAAIFVLAASVVLPNTVLGKSGMPKHRPTWAEETNMRKADYIYMEAIRQNALEHDDAFFELLRRSIELDSTDTQPSSTLGYFYMAMGQEDTTLSAKGFDMMRRHFNAHPSDYYSSIFYGMVNTQLGNTSEAIRVWSILSDKYPDKPDIALKLAQALQQSADSANLRQSIVVLNGLERAEGKDLGLTSAKIRAYMVLRDTAATYNELHSLLDVSQTNATNNIYAGDLFMVLNRPDSAISYYNRACEIDPTNGLAYYKRAEFYRERGDSVGFDREVFQAVRQDGLDIETKLEIFSSYIRQLYADSIQQPRIESLFDALILQNPHEPQVRDLYTSYLVARQDFKGAAEQQEYALDADLSNAQRWRSAISLYSTAGENEKALEMGEKALRYLPDDASLMFYTSNTLSALNREDEAIAYLHKALANTPDADNSLRSNILSAIGDALYRTGQSDSAFVYYDKALEADPDNLLALNNCAYFMAEQGKDLEKAERMSAICVRQQPDNDTSLDTYAWIFFKQKKYIKAKEIIDRALSIEADNPQAEVLHHAGDIYYMNGEPEAALEFWEEALKLDPDNKLLKKKVKNKTHYYE